MTLEKPVGTASKVGTYDLLKEQPGISVGTTWVARSAREGGDAGDGPRLFSVIRVHKHLTKKPEVADALVTETMAAMGFQHPNALALVGVGNEAGEIYVATQRQEGETLQALVTAAGTPGLPQPVVLRIVLDVLAALASAHAQDPALFHGELGPQHILVGDDGIARLTGLVSARALSRIAPPLGAKNHDRLSYAAPERVKGMGAGSGPPADARAEVFSVGVILWEGLSRQRLFTSKIEAAIVQKVLTAPIAALGGLAGITVSAPLAEIVHKALERDPAKRTPTVSALVTALEGLGADAIATPKQVADEVEKLAGKAIAVRKTEIRAEITRRGSKASSTIPPPAAAKPFSPSLRKATLLGIVSPFAKPAVAATVPAAPPVPEGLDDKVASSAKPLAPAEPSPKPAEVKPNRPAAESLNLEDLEVKAPALPPTIKRAVPVVPVKEAPSVAKAPAEAAASLPKPPRPPVEAPPPSAPVVKAAEKAPPSSPASASSATSTPRPAAAVQHLLDVASTKTAPTPGSDGPSSRSKSGIAIEKVGPGSTLGRYEILMPVARGGMASVWAAKLPGSRGFQKIFAIKTMLPDVSDDPEFESMFLDEGRVAARIRHPNVVEIIDLGEQDDVLYLVMEWVEGENLGSLVKAARGHGGVPLPVILRLASQVCAGLHAAHELRDDDGNLLDLVHRDISPANVLVSTSGFVKIVDFGIAKSKGRLTVTRIGGTVKGKTPYLSPEQLGQQPVDRRSDIFSFGVLLYVLATGLHPFRGDTDTKTIENIALREPVPLRALVATTPPEFEALVLKALSKDPADRFSTAGELQRALDQIAGMLGFTTTEEDVAAFVRKALGETLTKRAHDLRSAVDRAEGKTPTPLVEVEPALTVRPLPIVAVEAVAAGIAAEASAPASAPKPPASVKDAPEAVSAKAPGASGAPGADAEEKAIEEEVSFEAAPVVPKSIGADVLPRPKQPDSPTLPEILPGDEPGPTEATSPPVTRSDADDVPVDTGPPRQRKPVVMIAVGAVLGLCAIIAGVAALSGGEKKTPATTPAMTAVMATAPPVPDPAAAALTATATTAPTPAPTPEAATPPPPTSQATAEPTPPAVAPPAAVPPAITPPHTGGTKGTLPSKPPPVTKPKPPKKPYNPGTL